MLGISVYFQDLNLKYLEEAKKCGAKYVFTSLHIPEEDYSDLDQKLPLFLEKCHSLGLQVVPDVSPVTFEKLNIPHQDYKQLKRMGFKALRLDYGFDDYEVIKELQKDFYLMLNASVVNDQYLKGAQEAGVDFDKLALTHNFYPHSETGLSLEYFQKKNKTFQKYHLTVQAFVCGDVLKRFPLYEGLPIVGIEAQTNGLKCYFANTITDQVSISTDSVFLPLDKNDWVKNISEFINSNPNILDRNYGVINCKKAGFDINTEIMKIKGILK